MPSWFKKQKYTTLAPPASKGRIPEGLWVKCPNCVETIPKKEWEEDIKVCPKCGHHDRLSAPQRIEHLLDENSFEEHDRDLAAGDPLAFRDGKPYPERMAAARERCGMNEAVLCGLGRVQGQPVSVAVMDMGFIGGSMGTAAGEKIARALERALEREIPAILACASGGARMQEGALSLMQMAKTCAVAGRLHQAGLPLVTILTDPTTGGVSASFAMIGDVVISEPNALIGFAGRRVIEATIRQILPPGFQRAEFVADHGFVDIVCRRAELRGTISNLLSFFLHSRKMAAKGRAEAEPAEAALAAAQGAQA